MTLNEYLKDKDYREFAAEIGVCENTVYRYLVGLRYPRREIVKRIVNVTDGKVTVADLMGIG